MAYHIAYRDHSSHDKNLSYCDVDDIVDDVFGYVENKHRPFRPALYGRHLHSGTSPRRFSLGLLWLRSLMQSLGCKYPFYHPQPQCTYLQQGTTWLYVHLKKERHGKGFFYQVTIHKNCLDENHHINKDWLFNKLWYISILANMQLHNTTFAFTDIRYCYTKKNR